MDYLTVKQSNILLKEVTNIKHRVIILLMLDCGLRVTEACTVEVKSFDFAKKTLKIKTLKRDNHYRKIPLSLRLYHAIAELLEKKNIKEGYLFVGKNEGHIGRLAVNKITNRIKKITGINVTPHTFRHTYATHTLATSNNLLLVKENLGHSNYNSTAIYAHISDEAKENGALELEKKRIGKVKYWLLSLKDRQINTPTNYTGAVQFIGRNEIMRSIDLGVANNSNLLLIGEKGTGKSSILEQYIKEKKTLQFDDTQSWKKSLTMALLNAYKDKEKIRQLIYGDLLEDKIFIKIQKESVGNLTQLLMDVYWSSGSRLVGCSLRQVCLSLTASDLIYFQRTASPFVAPFSALSRSSSLTFGSFGRRSLI